MTKQKDLSLNEEGQTLLEVLLAFSVSILALSAVILGIITSLNNAQHTKNQSLASFYAQEGMAVIRKMRDSNLNTFSLFGTFTPSNKIAYCLGPGANDLGESDRLSVYPNCREQKPVGGIFSREVRFEHESSDCRMEIPPPPIPTPAIILKGSKVTVIVSWTDNKCPTPLCHKVELINCFSKIDQKQPL
jgi:hypothetical protein